MKKSPKTMWIVYGYYNEPSRLWNETERVRMTYVCGGERRPRKGDHSVESTRKRLVELGETKPRVYVRQYVGQRPSSV